MFLSLEKTPKKLVLLHDPPECECLYFKNRPTYNENQRSHDPQIERETNEICMSLIPKPKQRDKIVQMLWTYSGTSGVYIHVDSKGNIKHCAKISLHSHYSDPRFIELLVCKKMKNDVGLYGMMFLCTNKNRMIRIKRHWPIRYNRKRDKKQRKREDKKRRKLLALEKKCEKEPKESKNKNDSKPTSKSNVFDNRDDESEENLLEDYASDDDDVEEESETQSNSYKTCEKKKRIKHKKIPKNLRYLYSDTYACPKHSKRRTQLITLLQTDVVCTPIIKLCKEGENEEENYELEENDYCHFASRNSTFANFFTTQHLTMLGLNDQFEKQDLRNDCFPPDAFDIDMVTKDANLSLTIDMPTEDNEKLKENQETSPIESTNINTSITKDKIIKTNESLSKDAFVNLSRTSIRPDKLCTEFKEKFQEAQCKNRRFVINIRHLAHQNLIRMQLLPLDIISQSDISIYMIFVYVTEAKSDTDKYRVWINSNLPLSKPSEMFHKLTIKELTSISELIHKAMEALDNPVVIQYLKQSRKNKNYYGTSLPTSTFHLLWSTRLKLKLKESLQIDSHSHILSVKGKNISNQNQKIHQGPATSSMCGICLQTFNLNDCFPFSLTVCSHWFCEDCWKLKLCSQIKKRENDSILCIEHKCSSAIDYATLISILDIKLISNFLNYNNVKNMIREESNVIFCPNRMCEKSTHSQNVIAILQANKPDQFMPVKCSCQRQYCYKCLESPHWPVNCDISNIYHKCLDAQYLNNFDRVLRDEELPDLVLRGKSCPRCGIFIQEKSNEFKFEKCACGCEFCWPCGKKIDNEKKDIHSICLQRFELSNKELKAKMMKRAIDGESDIKISRWFKVALTHRQMRHPQVVYMLYAMADQIASRIYEVSEFGKYIGDVKSASVGWKSVLRKWNKRMCKQLGKLELLHLDYNDNIENMNDVERPNSCGQLSVLSNDSIGIGRGDVDTDNDSESLKSLDTESTFDFPIVGQMPVKIESRSVIFKAVSNIVQVKLEIHQIIEYTAVMLEFEHSLNTSGSTGRIIRCLERAEDLCEALGLLLQIPHKENVPRIIPSFLRLRLQLTNMLSTLYCNLKSVSY